jgi:hypothetical protein
MEKLGGNAPRGASLAVAAAIATVLILTGFTGDAQAQADQGCCFCFSAPKCDNANANGCSAQMQNDPSCVFILGGACQNDMCIGGTQTPTWTRTATVTATPTLTGTSTATPVSTATATATRTQTATATATATATDTATATATHTATSTDTATETASPTATAVDTATATSTATATATDTATDTATPTATPTETDTQTATPTATATDADTATATPSATATDTDTPTDTPTQTPTDTATPADTSTATATDTVTATHTAESTATDTVTPSETPTPTLTATSTATRTSTSTATGTVTPTLTLTATATDTPTPTQTPICKLTPDPACADSDFPRVLRLASKPDGNKLVWRWRTSAGTLHSSDFGDPLTTSDYALCIYAGDPPALAAQYVALAGGLCGGRPCWKQKPKGFRYKNKSATGEQLRKLVLRATTGPIADLKAVGRGASLILPPLPFPDHPVTVQLMKSDSPECWQNVFSPPFKKNDSARFKDKSDP